MYLFVVIFIFQNIKSEDAGKSFWHITQRALHVFVVFILVFVCDSALECYSPTVGTMTGSLRRHCIKEDRGIRNLIQPFGCQDGQMNCHPTHIWRLGVDRYVFFRADADTDYYSSSRPITDILNRYTCLV